MLLYAILPVEIIANYINRDLVTLSLLQTVCSSRQNSIYGFMHRAKRSKNQNQDYKIYIHQMHAHVKIRGVSHCEQNYILKSDATYRSSKMDFTEVSRVVKKKKKVIPHIGTSSRVVGRLFTCPFLVKSGEDLRRAISGARYSSKFVAR